MNSLYILTILCAIVGPTFSLPEEGKWDVVVTAVSKYIIYIILLLMPRRFSEQSANNSKENCVQGS